MFLFFVFYSSDDQVLFIPPCCYVFKGAEVCEQDLDGTSDDSNNDGSSSSCCDNDEEEREKETPAEKVEKEGPVLEACSVLDSTVADQAQLAVSTGGSNEPLGDGQAAGSEVSTESQPAEDGFTITSTCV